MSKQYFVRSKNILSTICSQWYSKLADTEDSETICKQWIENRLSNTPLKFIGYSNPYYSGDFQSFKPENRFKLAWPAFYFWLKEKVNRPKLGITNRSAKIFTNWGLKLNEDNIHKSRKSKTHRKSRFSKLKEIDFEIPPEEFSTEFKKQIQTNTSENSEASTNFESIYSDTNHDNESLSEKDINSPLKASIFDEDVSEKTRSWFNTDDGFLFKNKSLFQTNIYDQDQINNCDLRIKLLKESSQMNNSNLRTKTKLSLWWIPQKPLDLIIKKEYEDNNSYLSSKNTNRKLHHQSQSIINMLLNIKEEC